MERQPLLVTAEEAAKIGVAMDLRFNGPGVEQHGSQILINPPTKRSSPAAPASRAASSNQTNGTVTGQVWQTVSENVNAHQFPVAHAIT